MSCHNVDAAAATIDAFTDRVPDNLPACLVKADALAATA